MRVTADTRLMLVVVTVLGVIALGAGSSGAGALAIAPPPSDVRATGATTSAISLRWTGDVLAMSYGVYRNGTLIGSTTETTFTVAGLACGTTYTLGVDAVDVLGGRSSATSIAAATSTCPDTTPPTPPTGLAVTGATQTSIALSWNPSTDAVGVTGYRVYRNGALVASVGAATRSYTFTGLSCGTSYTLAVEAYDAAGNRSARATSVAATTACSPPPPPPPPPGGTVKFRGDWETGNRFQWSGAQCENTGVPDDQTTDRGTLTVVQDVIGRGAYAGRFDLDQSSKVTACEALRGRTLELSEEWYALEFRLPSNYQAPGWGLSLAQFNFQNIHGSAISIVGRPGNVRLMLQSGFCEPAPRGCAYSSGDGGNVAPMYAVPSSVFQLNVWHQLVVRVKWTTGSDGIIDIFHRKRGQSAWIQTVGHSGTPTVQWKAGFTPQPGHGTNDKIGAYRGSSTVSLSVWHDSFCVATTRSSAESCL